MLGVKNLERSEVLSRWLLRARLPQVLKGHIRHLSNCLEGGRRRLVDGQRDWIIFGANFGGAFCYDTVSVGSCLWTGSFSCASRGIFLMRNVASQSGYDDEVSDAEYVEASMSCSDEEIELSNSSLSVGGLSEMSSATEGSGKRFSNKQRQQKQMNAAPNEAHLADGEDVDQDELTVSSPLDAASETLMTETGNVSRPLWKRLEEASEKTKHFLLQDAFDEWTAEGNSLNRAVIIYTITILRKRRKYWRAMEVSDWLMREKPFQLNDMDFGIRVELIAKLQGARKAADYFATIPKVFQTSMVYSILLSAYVEQNKEREAIDLLKTVEKLGLSHRTYMYNQLLHLYKKNGLVAGVAEVLKTMEEKHVEADIFTYNMILDVRARKGDVRGMESVFNYIKEDHNVEPDASTYAVLAKGYITAGIPEKAQKAVEKIEQSPFRTKRFVNLLLLKLYGSLGMEDDLERVWCSVTEGPRVGHADYITMIRALGKVGNSCRAEDLFEEMELKLGISTVHHYNALFSVYANLGRTQKGETLLKQLSRAKLHANPATYHELVCMYIKAGQLHKAMEVLSVAHKASRISIRKRPMYVTYHTILEDYAQKGDVKSAEKLVKDLKCAGYTCAFRSYVALLKAYENGAMSPYGFLDRLKADNIIPNQQIRKQLRILDGT